MVALVDRSHPSYPASRLVHPTAMTCTKPLLRTTSALTSPGPQKQGSFLATYPRIGSLFSSQKEELEALPPPASLRYPRTELRAVSPLLPSCVLPASSMMSNQVIQSFRNRLLFTATAFVGFSFHQKAFAYEGRCITCSVDTARVKDMLTSPEGNLNNGGRVFDCHQNGPTTLTPHQKNATTSFLECGPTNAMNLITESEVTQVDTEQEIVGIESSEQLHRDQDLDHSNSEPIQIRYESDDNQSDDSDDDDDDDDDDCVQFSDESANIVETQPQELKCTQYVTLVSSESGYFEYVPQVADNEVSDDCWSDDSDSEGEFCSEVWASFETQALSPMVVPCKSGQAKTQSTSNVCSTSKLKQTHSTPNSSHCEVHPCMDTTKDQRTCRQHNVITFQTPKKRVSFKPDNELIEVHTIVAWEYAYRAARKGPWEQYARDRSHFRRRIDSISPILEPCLSAKLTRMSSVSDF